MEMKKGDRVRSKVTDSLGTVWSMSNQLPGERGDWPLVDWDYSRSLWDHYRSLVEDPKTLTVVQPHIEASDLQIPCDAFKAALPCFVELMAREQLEVLIEGCFDALQMDVHEFNWYRKCRD